jgi:ApbE superfamily uncharacterized protein (UPF0280 family)
MLRAGAKLMYEKRIYRNLFKGVNLKFFNVSILETDLCIGSDRDLYKEALSAAKKYRHQIETYIKLCPEFLTSLEPIPFHPASPVIVQKMCEAAKKANVGPMAAVAGAIAQMVGIDLLNYSDEVIVENGGTYLLERRKPAK